MNTRTELGARAEACPEDLPLLTCEQLENMESSSNNVQFIQKSKMLVSDDHFRPDGEDTHNDHNHNCMQIMTYSVRPGSPTTTATCTCE